MLKKIALTTSLLSSSVMAETVYLKNGTILKGVIVSMDQTDLIVDTAEIGRVTVKRYSVDKILDGEVAEEQEKKTVINVNNSNQVDQQQSNVQTNEQTLATSKLPKVRQWQQGVQGRFHVMAENLTFYVDQEKTTSDSYLGVDWDLIGFRSESFWSIFLNASAASREEYESTFTLSTVSLRLDFNLFQQTHGTALSQVYLGLGGGTVTYTEEYSFLDMEYEVTGKRAVAKLGYDYLWGKNWGLSLYASVSGIEFDELPNASIENGDNDSSAEIGAISTSLGIGLSYNFDS